VVTARRGSSTPGRRAAKARRPRARLGPVASDLVIVSRALADLAEFLHGRQEAAGRGRVILDRRVGDRRVTAVAVEEERRRSDRRRAASDGAEALMRVLGFMIVPGAPPPAGPARASRRPVRA
jgi:hypothetical protein